MILTGEKRLVMFEYYLERKKRLVMFEYDFDRRKTSSNVRI
jgi:hypothetical protein